MVLNFGAVILLPLAEATTINFTVPIWAVLLSILLLKEKVGLWRWSAVVLGFVGILVIAQPSAIGIVRNWRQNMISSRWMPRCEASLISADIVDSAAIAPRRISSASSGRWAGAASTLPP